MKRSCTNQPEINTLTLKEGAKPVHLLEGSKYKGTPRPVRAEIIAIDGAGAGSVRWSTKAKKPRTTIDMFGGAKFLPGDAPPPLWGDADIYLDIPTGAGGDAEVTVSVWPLVGGVQ